MNNIAYHTNLMSHWVISFNKKYPTSSLNYRYDKEINTHIIDVDTKTFKNKKIKNIFSRVIREASIKFQLNLQFIPKGTLPDYIKAISRVNKTATANKRIKKLKELSDA